MRRLCRIGLICIALCAGAIALARRIGETQVSPLAAIFTMPDGTPCPEACLFGVQPGKTSYAEAIILLRQHPMTHALRPRESSSFVSVFEGEASSFDIDLVKSPDRDVLLDITLTNMKPTLSQVSSASSTLGEMLSLLGPPTAVLVHDVALTETYYAADRIILITMRAGDGVSVPVSLGDSVVAIVLYAPGQLENATRVRNQQFKAWQGFRHAGRYWDAPEIELTP